MELQRFPKKQAFQGPATSLSPGQAAAAEGSCPLELAWPARTGLICLWERMGPENKTDQTRAFTASSETWVFRYYHLFFCLFVCLVLKDKAEALTSCVLKVLGA